MNIQWYKSLFAIPQNIENKYLRFYNHQDCKDSYCAPVISNGTLYTQIDYSGTQEQSFSYTNHGARKVKADLTPNVFIAGRRYDTMLRELVGFGYFKEKASILDKNLEIQANSQQVLDLKNGALSCYNELNNNSAITTCAFVHNKHNMLAVRKKFSNIPSNFVYTFEYNYAVQNSDSASIRCSKYQITPLHNNNGVEIVYEIDNKQNLQGKITILTPNCKPEIIIDNATVSLRFTTVPNTLDFYMLYTDSFNGNDYQKEQEQLINKVNNLDFEGLFSENANSWNSFWNGFALELPDKKMQDVFYSAVYNLKCTSTPWGIPVGIHTYSWNGNYFAFNLFTSLFCMLNDQEAAKRIPMFRFNTLKNAIARTSNWSYSAGAKYPWQSDEEGFFECSSPGVWNDHIFQMGNIALEAYEYFNYTKDLNFLKEISYPVIKECAKFFMLQAIYTIGKNKKIIGKFCDLEKFGTARENAFLTTCGVISTLKIAAKTAEILDVDSDLKLDWLATAKALQKSLPNDGEKYIGYANCQEKSIGVLGGLYPYHVLDKKDSKQLAAIEDYMDSSTAAGNMYPYGKNICTWYAAWVANALIRLEKTENAMTFLKKAANSTGAFDIVYEINEPGIFVSHPWCSAPPACYVQGILELLCRVEKDTLLVCQNLENTWKDISFTLSTPDDLTITLKMKNSQIEYLSVTANTNYTGTIKKIKILNKNIKLNLKPNNTKILYNK